MKILNNVSLKEYSTFRSDFKAKKIIIIENIEDIYDFLNSPYKNTPKVLLGNGSNTIFTKDFENIILKIEIKGKKLIDENKDYIFIEYGAGEFWNKIAWENSKENFLGSECLIDIPGTLGGAIYQNIGAYGQEISNIVYSVRGIDLSNKKEINFSKKECKFGYRKSIFQNKIFKENFIITHVILKFRKNKEKYLKIPSQLLNYLSKNNQKVKTPFQLSNIISFIRKLKLPDFNKLPNCGSFFKNPIIEKEELIFLNKKIDSSIPYFKIKNKYKIPAGFLIEKAGWKGKRIGNIGVYHKHSLIIVNYGENNFSNFFKLINSIKKDIKKKYNILLKEEVRIIK